VKIGKMRTPTLVSPDRDRETRATIIQVYKKGWINYSASANSMPLPVRDEVKERRNFRQPHLRNHKNSPDGST